MRTWTKFTHFGLAFLLMMLMLGTSSQVTAQTQVYDPGFYTSELTGMGIEVSGPEYEIVGVALKHYSGGEGETIDIEAGTSVASLEISFFDDADSANETLSLYMDAMDDAADSFALVDRGVSGDNVYGLALIGYEGVEIVYLVQVYEDIQGNVDLLQSILTTPELLEDDLTTAQNEVAIDGLAFMENIDASSLSSALSDGGTIDENPSATAVGTGDMVQFTLADIEIGIGPDFSFVGEPVVDQGIESVQIVGPDSMSVVAVGEPGESISDVMDQFQSGVTIVYPDTHRVYEEIQADAGWRLVFVPKGDDSATFLLLVADTSMIPGTIVMQSHEFSSENVAGGIMSIQAQVTVNGTPLMAEIDSEEIGFYADRHLDQSGEAGSSEETVATATVSTEESGDPRTGARLPSGSDGEGEGNSSEVQVPVEGTPEQGSEPDTTSTLTDSSWEGLESGHLIEWDGANWEIYAQPQSVGSEDTAWGTDTIILASSQSTLPNGVSINLHVGDDQTPQDFLENWQSEEFIETYEETWDYENTEILGTRTRANSVAIVYMYDAADGNQYILIREAALMDDGVMRETWLDVAASDATMMYESVLADIQVDGSPVFSVYSISQLERLLQD